MRAFILAAAVVLSGCMTRVFVQTIPPGAEIFVNGTSQGVSPCGVMVPESSNRPTIVAKKAGYFPAQTVVCPGTDVMLAIMTFGIAGDEWPSNVTLQLKPDPDAAPEPERPAPSPPAPKPAPAPAPAPSATLEVSQPKPQTARFCASCGARFDEAAKFCASCGAKR